MFQINRTNVISTRPRVPMLSQDVLLWKAIRLHASSPPPSRLRLFWDRLQRIGAQPRRNG